METNTPTANGPLHGIRVVELAAAWTSMCGRILADLGAEVIVVEPPGGAALRTMGPFAGSADAEPGISLPWAALALNKRSVVLDLHAEPGRAQLLALLDSADVFVESHPPGTLGVLGLGYTHLRERLPPLIFASITPYGQTGPDALSPATDLSLQAAGGLVALQGDADRPNLPVGFPQAGFHAGAQAAADITIALFERSASGLGQHLDVSAQAAVVWTLMNATGYPANTQGNAPGTCETRKTPPVMFPGFRVPPVWPCADGYIVMNISLPVLGGRTLQGLADWMRAEGALPESLQAHDWTNWIADVVGGAKSIDEVSDVLEAAKAFMLTQPKSAVQRFALLSGSVVGPIYTVQDLVEDPHLKARDYWTDISGRVHPGSFAKLSRTPIQLRSPAPAAGENQALLTESRPSPPLPSANGQRRQPFAGLKVADFAWVGVGPIMSKALADHGATVVRVESETRPDTLRLIPPFRDNVPGLNRSQFFSNFNTSKYGLALDLASAEAREVAHRLIDWADVVVESFTPGTMAKWGLDYASISARRPDLIMVSTCLRGQTGPEAKFTGFGGQGAALAGIHSVTGWPDRPPTGPWGAYTDFITPRFGVSAIASALLHRRQTGEGQAIDLAQSEAGIRFIEPLVLDYTVNGAVASPPGARSRYESPHGVFECVGPERFVAISVESAGQWQSLRAAIGLTGFDSPAFDDVAERRHHEVAIETAIAAWCSQREPFEVAALLKAVGVPAAVVQRPMDLFEDPQLAHRGFFVTLDHSEIGSTPYDGLVTTFSETPGILRCAGPVLGQDTNFVLTNLLAYSEEDFERLLISGALR